MYAELGAGSPEPSIIPYTNVSRRREPPWFRSSLPIQRDSHHDARAHGCEEDGPRRGELP